MLTTPKSPPGMDDRIAAESGEVVAQLADQLEARAHAAEVVPFEGPDEQESLPHLGRDPVNDAELDP